MQVTISVLLISIIEAMLYDFHFRCRKFIWEGVSEIGEDALAYIRSKRIDKFARYIDSARKHNLFHDEHGDIYEQLDLLKRIRNRIHIQNESSDLEPNEIDAFTPARKIIAEQVLERVMKIMAVRFPRPAHAQGFVADFQLPWDEHYHHQAN
ncbi:MAG: hypothetical protein AB7O46_13945 [Xanthobacteraceae bacterium]